jgi:hypothetical protein
LNLFLSLPKMEKPEKSKAAFPKTEVLGKLLLF